MWRRACGVTGARRKSADSVAKSRDFGAKSRDLPQSQLISSAGKLTQPTSARTHSKSLRIFSQRLGTCGNVYRRRQRVRGLSGKSADFLSASRDSAAESADFIGESAHSVSESPDFPESLQTLSQSFGAQRQSPLTSPAGELTRSASPRILSKVSGLSHRVTGLNGRVCSLRHRISSLRQRVPGLSQRSPEFVPESGDSAAKSADSTSESAYSVNELADFSASPGTLRRSQPAHSRRLGIWRDVSPFCDRLQRPAARSGDSVAGSPHLGRRWDALNKLSPKARAPVPHRQAHRPAARGGFIRYQRAAVDSILSDATR